MGTVRPALMDWLSCPDCGSTSLTSETYSLDAEALDPEEVLDGVVRCGGCDSWFPVITGVPRMLPKDLREVLPEQYPTFFAAHAGKLPGTTASASARSEHTAGQVHVMEAFGFEWNEFAEYENDNFLEWVAPLQPEFFKGKFGLDAGCGAGRHAMRAHGFGADLVAMDLSPAVDAAYSKARKTTGIYVVQGDIFHPPLRPDLFEFIYSIGVIHHTPDPPTAFQSIATRLAPSGTIACFVYATGRPVALGVLAAIRKVTTRLPLPFVKFLSWLATVIDVVFPITAYRIARKLGAKPAQLEKMFPEHVRIYADRTFATNYTDWLDRLSYPYVHYYDRDDMAEWLDRAGLVDGTVTNVGKNGVTGVGTRAASGVSSAAS